MAINKWKTSDGLIRFQVKVKDRSGKWFPTPSFADEGEAKIYEGELLKQKRQGATTITQDSRVVTLNEFWEVWSHENRSKVSEGWKISQDQMFRDYIAPVAGQEKMLNITAPVVGRILNRMRSAKEMPDGRARGEQMVKHVYTLLRTMFGDAVGYYKMLKESPVSPKFHRPKVTEKESDYLFPEQAWLLLERSQEHWLGPALWLDVLAGLRCEATCALKWDSVLWDTDQILICRAWKAKVRRLENYPKGKTWEYVPMVPDLRAYLWSLWIKSGDPDAFVCLSPRGKMLKPETYLQNLKKLCRGLGLPEVSPHGLRHSCSELFVREGASQVDIGRLLNHKQPSTTSRYMHRSDERLRAISAKVRKPALRVIEGQGQQSFQGSFQSWKQKPYEGPQEGEVSAV